MAERDLRAYEGKSLAMHTVFLLLWIVGNIKHLEGPGIAFGIVYLAILACYGALWYALLHNPAAYAKWRNLVTAVMRSATLICLNWALPHWTVESGSCLADSLKAVTLGTGVLSSIFNTLFLPLPGLWHFGVHLATTLVFLHTHNARVCHDLLRQHSNGCSKLTESWQRVELLGQTLAGLVGLIVVPNELKALQPQQQCQVAVGFVQVCFPSSICLSGQLCQGPSAWSVCYQVQRLVVYAHLLRPQLSSV